MDSYFCEILTLDVTRFFKFDVTDFAKDHRWKLLGLMVMDLNLVVAFPPHLK
jgi:hypothetical protein